MLVKSDSEKEKKIVEDIITNDEQLKQQHELFVAEMAFKQEMINARKTLSLTQKDVSRLSGLSQQAVSRIENGASGTISTVRVEFYSNDNSLDYLTKGKGHNRAIYTCKLDQVNNLKLKLQVSIRNKRDEMIAFADEKVILINRNDISDDDKSAQDSATGLIQRNGSWEFE